MEVATFESFGLASAEKATTTSGCIFQPFLENYSSFVIQIKHIQATSIPAQLAAIQQFFGLTKSDLARILHITRPALYAWFDETSEPNAENARRIQSLYALVDTAEAMNRRPLFHAYIERPVASLSRSLLDALSENHINPEEIRTMTTVIRKMTEARDARIRKSRRLEAGIFSETEQGQILDANLLAIQSGD